MLTWIITFQYILITTITLDVIVVPLNCYLIVYINSKHIHCSTVQCHYFPKIVDNDLY